MLEWLRDVCKMRSHLLLKRREYLLVRAKLQEHHGRDDAWSLIDTRWASRALLRALLSYRCHKHVTFFIGWFMYFPFLQHATAVSYLVK
jgi:hypothetical protein